MNQKITFDVQGMKRKLNQLNSKGKTSQYIFKPKPGKTTIRIIPYAYNPQNPFIELYFHYNFLKQNILSPISFGRPDPIEQFAENLMSRGKDEYKIGLGIKAKMRTYVPIIVRQKDSDTVEFKFWGIGKEIYTQLLNMIVDEEIGYGIIFDPIEGNDIILQYTDPKAAGNDYGKTKINIVHKKSPICKNEAKMKELLTNQPKLEEIYEQKSYEELQKMLNRYCNPPASDGKDVVQSHDSVDTTSVSEAISVSDEQSADDILKQFQGMIS